MALLTFKEYESFYGKYGKTIDNITTEIKLSEKELKVLYVLYLKNFKEGHIVLENLLINNLPIKGENKMSKTLDDAYDDELTETQKAIKKVGKSLTNFIIEKNRNYGNSALEPLKIFSKHIAVVGEDVNFTLNDVTVDENKRRRALNLMLTRLDDKLSRVKNAPNLRKNDVSDILGYLILVCVNLGWDDFSELID